MADITDEIAASAAQCVVEEGLEYGPAKRRALKILGLPPKTPLPNNEQLEAQVKDYIELFCADTQPTELLALRQHALMWMQRLQDFRPYLGGAVWHGTATRWSDIYLQLFCDDEKSCEIELINKGVDFEARTVNGLHGEPVEALSIHSFCKELGEEIGVHLLINEYDDVRGALKADAQGRAPRGDALAVQRLIETKSI
ncbi:MAG: hypothetical protein RL650_1916 [Pseudomonadota bacterium]